MTQSEKNWSPLPFNRIRIDGVEIPADKIEQGGVSHDIDDATVTVTFANVRTLEVVYSHMEREADNG